MPPNRPPPEPPLRGQGCYRDIITYDHDSERYCYCVVIKEGEEIRVCDWAAIFFLVFIDILLHAKTLLKKIIDFTSELVLLQLQSRGVKLPPESFWVPGELNGGRATRTTNKQRHQRRQFGGTRRRHPITQELLGSGGAQRWWWSATKCLLGQPEQTTPRCACKHNQPSFKCNARHCQAGRKPGIWGEAGVKPHRIWSAKRGYFTSFAPTAALDLVGTDTGGIPKPSIEVALKL